jgi:hypothetical protein
MKYLIEEKLANAILNYLVGRPYIEVANLVQGINSLIPVKEAPAPVTQEATKEIPECACKK